jgi:hypothetical protein
MITTHLALCILLVGIQDVTQVIDLAPVLPKIIRVVRDALEEVDPLGRGIQGLAIPVGALVRLLEGMVTIHTLRTIEEVDLLGRDIRGLTIPVGALVRLLGGMTQGSDTLKTTEEADLLGRDIRGLTIPVGALVRLLGGMAQGSDTLKTTEEADLLGRDIQGLGRPLIGTLVGTTQRVITPTTTEKAGDVPEPQRDTLPVITPDLLSHWRGRHRLRHR